MTKDRINEINRQISALANADLRALIQARIEEHTVSLIGENNEQVRGRIKALRDLLDLPEALQAEREGITAELPETDSAS